MNEEEMNEMTAQKPEEEEIQSENPLSNLADAISHQLAEDEEDNNTNPEPEENTAANEDEAPTPTHEEDTNEQISPEEPPEEQNEEQANETVEENHVSTPEEAENNKEEEETNESKETNEEETEENNHNEEETKIDPDALTGFASALTQELIGEENSTPNEEEEDNDQNEEQIEQNGSTVMITTISNVVQPPTEPRPPRSARPNRAATPEAPTYTDEELDSALKTMLKKKKAPELMMQQPLRDYINKLELIATQNSKYEEAARLEQAMELLNELSFYDDTETILSQKRKDAEEKLQNTKERHAEAAEKWETKISTYKKEQELVLKDIEAQHEQELAEFERNWNDPSFLAAYNKPSPRLLQLRHVEQSLAIAKLFERAAQVRKQADQLQKEETAVAREKAMTAMRLTFEALDQKQQRDIECHLQHTKRNIEYMEKERDKELNPMKMIIERHAEAAQVTMPTDKSGMAPRREKRPLRCPNTYKDNNTKVSTLDLGGINTKSFIKARKLTTPRPKKT